MSDERTVIPQHHILMVSEGLARRYGREKALDITREDVNVWAEMERRTISFPVLVETHDWMERQHRLYWRFASVPANCGLTRERVDELLSGPVTFSVCTEIPNGETV